VFALRRFEAGFMPAARRAMPYLQKRKVGLPSQDIGFAPVLVRWARAKVPAWWISASRNLSFR
jgi:hypothetical protein